MSAAPRIDVWVCARPHAPHLDAVLAALTAAGAEPRVAVSPAGQGLASARNEALAACEGEILALVDDDVEVSPGWLDAQRAAWSSSGAAELGCVGGPLAAVFSGERPAWLGDALLPALGVDPGPPADGAAGVPVPVDAEKRTFHSGNIAFRVTALRGVGGFWPARGRPGLRDWFGEEHLAQRELARAGWRAAWLHEAHAARRISHADVRPLDFLRLRARQGARWGAVGPPTPRATAIRAAATATAGVAVAATRRDAAKLVERASRAAHNAGVLAAPLLAHRSLQPTASRTRYTFSVPPAAPGPLRAAAPRLARRVRRQGRSSPLVLLYHRVAAHGDDPLALMVSPPHFAQQLEVLATRRRPVALARSWRTRLPNQPSQSPSTTGTPMSSTRVWLRSRRPASPSRSSSAAATSAPARHSGGTRWRGRSALRRPMQARSSSTSTARRARGRPAIGPSGTPRSVGSQRGFTRSLPRRSRARCGRSGNGRAPATCSPRLPRTGR